MRSYDYTLMEPKVFCGDGSDPEPTPAPKPSDPVPDPPSNNDDVDLDNLPPGTTLTQEQMNKAMGKLRAKYREDHEKLAKSLEVATKEINMTKEERERLTKVLEQSRSTYQTEIERSKETTTKLQEELNTVKQMTEKELAAWRKRFETTLIDHEVAAACAEANVYSHTQIRDLLDRHLSATQVVDDKGNQTEKFVVVVKTTDDKGEVINMPVLDYIKKMDESGSHPNLFKHNMKGGLNTTNGNKKDGSDSVPTDPKELAEWLSVPENRERFLKQSTKG